MEIITRICSKCKRDLPLSNYVWRFKSKGIRKHNCKDCDKIYKAEYYRNNSEKCKAKVAQDKRDRVALFKQYKSNLKCAACPESESCVIDFHHVDPTTKKFDVSQKVWETSWDTLLIEINKCIPLCKNCHAKLHNGMLDIAALV